MITSHGLCQNNDKATRLKVKNIIQTSYLATYEYEQIKKWFDLLSHLKLNRFIEVNLYLQL